MFIFGLIYVCIWSYHHYFKKLLLLFLYLLPRQELVRIGNLGIFNLLG